MLKVLIIEDDHLFRITLTEMFIQAGYKRDRNHHSTA